MMKCLARLCALALLVVGVTLAVSCSDNGEDVSNKNAVAPAVKPANPTTATAKYGGAVDMVSCNGISGWVSDGANPNADINVDIYVDGKLIGTVPAKNPRPDLKKNWGFAISIPPELKDGKPHSASAKVSGSDYTLTVWEKIQPTFNCRPK